MRILILIRILLLKLFIQHVAADVRAIYLFKDVLKSNTTALTTSSFNTVVIFGVGIIDDGSIMYYSNTPGSSDIVVAKGGAYVGGSALATKVTSLKASGSGINRVEICMNSQHVKDLMNKPGPGTDTPVAKNFAALKQAWGLDAVNNDDESLYDVASTVVFAKMLGKLGYKYTIAPYTNINFWISLRTQANQGLANPNLLLDRAYLQCYDGGAGNVPSDWANRLGLKVVPLVWVTNDAKPSFGTTAPQAKTKFSNWKAKGGLAGGGYWNDYDIEKMKLSYEEYGDVLATTFP